MAAVEVANLVDPNAALGYVVYTKKNWDDAWAIDADLIAVDAERLAGAGGNEHATLERAYGYQIRDPGGLLGNRNRRNLMRHWVKIALLVPDRNQRGVPETIFVGRIESRPEDVFGQDAGNRRNGIQRFKVLGPAYLLRKKNISQSFWLERVEVDPGKFELARQELGKMFSFNRRKGSGKIDGNRSENKIGGSHLFGNPIEGGAGTDTIWNRADIALYFVEQFLNEGDGGPVWKLGGAGLEYLFAIDTPLEMPPIIKLSDVFAQIINRELGLDFRIEPTTDGFEINVYALIAESIEYTLRSSGEKRFKYPRNRAKLTIDVSNRKYMRPKIEPSTAEQYDGVRVISDPIIVLGHVDELTKGWTAELETTYKAGDPAGTTDKDHDGARTADSLRAVFQRFASPDFDWKDKIPSVNLDGSEHQGDLPFQRKHRSTLTSLNLEEGVNYSTDPPGREHGSDVTPDERPLLALAWNAGRFAPIDVMSAMNPGKPSASVFALSDDWGMRLRSHPNHALAAANWAGAAGSAFDPAQDGLNWGQMRMTFAIRTDHRIELGVDLSANRQSGQGLLKIIRVPARFVWIPSGTTIDINDAGLPLRSPAKGEGFFAFEDFWKLAAEVPGAIARYLRRRTSATIEVGRLQTWNTGLGRILTAVMNNGFRQDVKTPITSVRWDFKNFTTTIQAGHANQ